MLLAMIMLFMGCGFGGSRRDKNAPRGQSPHGFRKIGPGGATAAGGAGGAGGAAPRSAGAGPATGGGNHIGFWRRQRLRRGRGSFGDNESQLRVKDEYA